MKSYAVRKVNIYVQHSTEADGRVLSRGQKPVFEYLQFTDKGRLTEFFQKACEMFPDTVVELVSTFECGDYAIAEWKLTGTQIEQFGSRSYRFPIVLRGSTIVQVENGRGAYWSDYYDELTSRRGPLKAFFEEWIEY